MQNNTVLYQRWRSPPLVVAGVVLVIIVAAVTVWRAGPYTFRGHIWGAQEHSSDFTVYLAAGRAVLAGSDIYKAQNQRGWMYLYPPPLAIAMVPLSMLPVPIAVLVWYLLSVLLMVFAVKWCAWLVHDPGLGASPPEILPLLMVAPFLVNALLRGQASVLLCVLVIGAIYFETRTCSLRGGACLAGAVLLKVFPAGLLLYFAWRRRWRFCLATAAAIVAIGWMLPVAVFGVSRTDALLIEWFRTVIQPAIALDAQRITSPLYGQLLRWGNIHDQSLYAVMGRMIGRAAPSLITYVRVITAAAILAMLAPTYLVGRGAWERGGSYMISSLIVWMLLASPITERHYFTLLVLPMFVVSRDALLNSDGSGHIARILVGIFLGDAVLASLPSDLVYPFWRDGWMCWSSILLWAGLLMLARERHVPGEVRISDVPVIETQGR